MIKVETKKFDTEVEFSGVYDYLLAEVSVSCMGVLGGYINFCRENGIPEEDIARHVQMVIDEITKTVSEEFRTVQGTFS